MSSSYRDQVLAASRLVETLVTEISLTRDRSEVFDFERRAMEAISPLHSPDRERLEERVQDAVSERLQRKDERLNPVLPVGGGAGKNSPRPVSYTHLTLPTILRV